MIDENVVAGMVRAISKINTTLYPYSLILPIILGTLFMIGYIPSFKKNMAGYFNVLIGCCYFYAGFPLLFTYEQLGSKAYLGGSILLLFSLVFFLMLFSRKKWLVHTSSISFRAIGTLLILYGILLYPIIEYLTGFSWPGMAVFGMECPTTIAVIGLLIATFNSSSKIVLFILCMNASFTGTSVAMHGAPFDWAYAIAGYIGIVIIVMDIIHKRRLPSSGPDAVL